MANCETTTETVYSNEVLYDWKKGTDPLNDCNDHKFSLVGGDASTQDQDTIQPDSKNREYRLGWTLENIGVSTSEIVNNNIAPDPDQKEIRVHYNLFEPDQYRAYTDLYHYVYDEVLKTGDVRWAPRCNPGISDAGPGMCMLAKYLFEDESQGGRGFVEWIVEPPDGFNKSFVNLSVLADHPEADYSGFFQTRLDLYFSLDRKYDIYRVPVAPDNPCEPCGKEPYPLVEGGQFCIINNQLVANKPWTKVEDTFKVLAAYYDTGGGFPAKVTRYPIGPVIPEDDPRYNDEDYWREEYAKAVDAGDLPDDMGYATNNTIPQAPDQYPVVQEFAYKRDVEVYVDNTELSCVQEPQEPDDDDVDTNDTETNPPIGNQNECYASILRQFDVSGVMSANLLWIEQLLGTLLPRGNYLDESGNLRFAFLQPISMDGQRIQNVTTDTTDAFSAVSLLYLNQLIQENT